MKLEVTKNKVIGLDIGTDSVKLVELENVFGTIRLTRIITKRLDSNPGMSYQEIALLQRHALQDIIQPNMFKAAKLFTCISRYACFVSAIEIPPVRNRKKIDEVIGFEVRQQTFFIQDQNIHYDYQTYENSGLELKVLLAAIHAEKIDIHMNQLREAGIRPEAIDVSSFGVFNSFSFNYNLKEDETTVLIDIGAKRTDIVIQHGTQPVYTRYIRIGGDHLTKALQDEFILTFKKAQKLKEEEGVILVRNPNNSVTREQTEKVKRISKALSIVLIDLVTEIQQTLLFYRQELKIQGVTIDKIILSGGTSRLKNLDKYLKINLNTNVELHNPLKNIKPISGFELPAKEDLSSYTIAAGLALKGLKKGAINIDLSPQTFKRLKQLKKEIISLMPFCILVFLLLLAIYHINLKSYKKREIQRSRISNQITHRQKNAELIEPISSRNKVSKNIVNSLVNLVERNNLYLEGLSALIKIAPPDVRFNKIDAAGDTAGNHILLTITGLLTTCDLLESFVRDLEESRFFSHVEIISVTGMSARTAESSTEVDNKTRKGRGRGRGRRSAKTEPQPEKEKSTADKKTSEEQKQKPLNFTINFKLHPDKKE